MKHLLLLILFSISTAYATIYEQTTDGAAIYSDTPPKNGKIVILPSLNNNISLPPTPGSTVSSTPSNTVNDTKSNASKDGPSYSTFEIADPVNGETFQNQRDIPVKLKIIPTLQKGNKIVLIVDDKTIGEPIDDLNQLIVRDLERGEHRISATITNSSGVQIKQAEGITIYIHYSAIPTGSGAVKTSASP